MNSYVDQLVDEQHAAIDAPRHFTATKTTQLRERSANLMDMYTRVYCVEPAFGWAMANDAPYSYIRFETDDYTEAIQCALSYLFCGSAWATVRSYSTNRRSEKFETWRAL
jgi:hypothetical protein